MRYSMLILIIVLLVSCNNLSVPVARLSTYPAKGDSTILFELNASQSTDDKCYEIALSYRWDFDGDQVWDTDYSDESVFIRHFENPGTYVISVQVRNPSGEASIATDTIVVFGKNKDVATLTDTRDGQVYATVKLEGRWWMAESLRYGQPVNPWNPGMTNNQQVERIIVTDPGNAQRTYSVYSWLEAVDYDLSSTKGICPEGWHLPTQAECKSIYAAYPSLYAAQYLGENGLSGIQLHEGAQVLADFGDSTLESSSNTSWYWSADHLTDNAGVFYASVLQYQANGSTGFIRTSAIQPDLNTNSAFYAAVRCVKD